MFEFFLILFWILVLLGVGWFLGYKRVFLDKIPFFKNEKFTAYADIDMLPDLRKAELMEDSGVGNQNSYYGNRSTKVRHFIYRNDKEYYTVSTIDGKIFLGFGPYTKFSDAKAQLSNLKKAFPIEVR